MNQTLTQMHLLDKDGKPAGGFTQSVGLDITWQDGPLGRGQERQQPNGCFVETVISAAVGRLEFYQTGGEPGGHGEFSCRENALALTKLQEALHWLQHRTADRERRDVEGTHGK